MVLSEVLLADVDTCLYQLSFSVNETPATEVRKPVDDDGFRFRGGEHELRLVHRAVPAVDLRDFFPCVVAEGLRVEELLPRFDSDRGGKVPVAVEDTWVWQGHAKTGLARAGVADIENGDVGVDAEFGGGFHVVDTFSRTASGEPSTTSEALSHSTKLRSSVCSGTVIVFFTTRHVGGRASSLVLTKICAPSTSAL